MSALASELVKGAGDRVSLAFGGTGKLGESRDRPAMAPPVVADLCCPPDTSFLSGSSGTVKLVAFAPLAS